MFLIVMIECLQITGHSTKYLSRPGTPPLPFPQILKVGSVSASAMGRERVERLLVGEEGTAVRLTFRSADTGEVCLLREGVE